MTSSNNGTFITTDISLKNFTVVLDSLGVESEGKNETTEVFAMLLKLEFHQFSENLSGWFKCDLYAQIDKFQEKLTSFAVFEIYFMVSRSDIRTAAEGITRYLSSRKKVWYTENREINKLYSYEYEESTYDGVSDISAEVYAENYQQSGTTLLNVETYPNPTVMHYITYDRYSYMDWIADIGGFYTLAIATFFILSTRVTYFANRKDAFHRRQGILPAFSMTYRNAEELSGLRYLVLAALGISEEMYFSDDFQKFLGEPCDSS